MRVTNETVADAAESVLDDLRNFTLVLAGRQVEHVWDRLSRYCGLPWSGGPAETWAYPYFDAIEATNAADEVLPVDVVATAALHPGLSRADLAFFWEQADRVAELLSSLPRDLVLRDANDEQLDHLGELAGWEDAPPLSLVSKVLHRKRPGLIPLVDRELLDWYRPITGERSAVGAWPGLLVALRSDLAGQNGLLLAILNAYLERQLGRQLSHVRLVDIVIWMGGRQ